METLAHRISIAMERKEWKASRVSQVGVRIFHLFFVDDLLLFGGASVRQVKVIKKILEAFCAESGQKLNCQNLKFSLYLL